MEIIKKEVEPNCECLRPDVEIQGDCTPPIIDVDTLDAEISYNDLINKPEINGTIVKGDHNGDYYGLVDKTTESNQVYATDDEGNPTTIPYSEEADPEYIVRRDENGDVTVPEEPGKDDAATSKKYVDDAIDEVLTKAVVFKGVLGNQTELPTEGNRNGDMYWIKEFVEPVPPGMLAGHTGTAIYNGTLEEWQFEKDEVYDPDEQTIIFNRAGQLAVQLSQEEYNNIEIKEDGLYLSLHGIEEGLAEEIARATQAESDLNDKIDEETQNREDADQDLSDRIDQEIEDREQADSDLADDYNSKIGDLENLTDPADNLVAAINTLSYNLNDEIMARADADEGLSDRIDQEVQDREDADTDLSDRINQEIEDRQDADNSLSDRIDQEVQDREDADSSLDDRLNQEVEDRENADMGLSDAIEAETERAESVEGDLSNLTTSEKSNLVGAINEVVTDLGNESDRAQQEEGQIRVDFAAADTAIYNYYGDTSELTTTDKTSAVAAINELNSTKVNANPSIAGATHTKITYDSKGLVTGGSDIVLTDVTDITATSSEVNQLHSSSITTADLTKLHNITADANELNILDGATLTTTELNYVDGVTSSIQGQIGDLSSLTTDAKTSLQAAINEVDSHTDTNTTDITTINSKIPEQASAQNQLADKEFVNSSIATNTGNFIGTFQSIADRDAYQGTLTNNDYCFVVETDQIGNTVYNRYKWSTATTPAAWQFEYALNNSSFTADQWAAINSNITAAGTTQITTNKNAIGTLSNLTTTAKTDVVSAINEINSSKQDNITGAATTITSSNLTVDRAVISNASGKVAVSETTSTELSYVHGVTSSIQPQINSKANIIFEDWTV